MGFFSAIGKVLGGVAKGVASVVKGIGKVALGAVNLAISNPMQTVAIGVGITALAGMGGMGPWSSLSGMTGAGAGAGAKAGTLASAGKSAATKIVSGGTGMGPVGANLSSLPGPVKNFVLQNQVGAGSGASLGSGIMGMKSVTPALNKMVTTPPSASAE